MQLSFSCFFSPLIHITLKSQFLLTTTKKNNVPYVPNVRTEPLSVAEPLQTQTARFEIPVNNEIGGLGWAI